jgi:hypothetical protein
MLRRESIGALLKVSIEQGTEELAQSAQPAAPGSASASMSVDTAVHAPTAPKPDSLATLLCVLAAVYGMHPGRLTRVIAQLCRHLRAF